MPATAINSQWFMDKVERINGELELTLTLPLPGNYSPEQAFPLPLDIFSGGEIAFPLPLPAPAVQALAEAQVAENLDTQEIQ